jgi:hypothetical protein
MRENVKATCKAELKNGLMEYWSTLTPAICQKYIAHVQKVLPAVIDANGGPTLF